MINYDEISPGVRDLVRELNEVHGFVTCDSGDGSNYEDGMTCAYPDRNVFMHFDTRQAAQSAKSRLELLYPSATVQITDEDELPGDAVLLWPDGITEGALDKMHVIITSGGLPK